MSDKDLRSAYTEQGFPEEPDLGRASLLEAMKAVLFWTLMPVSEMEKECKELKLPDPEEAEGKPGDDEDAKKDALFQRLCNELLNTISIYTSCDTAPLGRPPGGRPAGRPVGPPRRRVLVLRHGSRPDGPADPQLDTLGFEQAKWAAEYLAREVKSIPGFTPITHIFCSPFIRALQTATPVAKELGLPIQVEYGFCELLAAGWLHSFDPLPELRFKVPAAMPMEEHIDRSYEPAVMPTYPDVVGRLSPGDSGRRDKPLRRHRDALNAVLEHAGTGSVLIVAHGATHDFVAGALCPTQHKQKHHTPFTVDHCSLTEIVSEGDGWHLSAFGSLPWYTLDNVRQGRVLFRDVYAESTR